MSQLSEYISGYIKEELSSALASSTDQLRMMFSGPPKDILEDVFSTMSHEGSLLDIECGDQIIKMPIFMIDPKAKDPQKLESARCTHNYLVNIRNSSCETYLALHAQGDNTNLSLETAATRMGISHHDHYEFEDWYKEPFIVNIINATIARYITSNHAEYPVYTNIVQHSLGNAWECDQRNKDKRALWRIIKDLYEADLGDSPKNVFMAIVGLPYSDKEMSTSMIKKGNIPSRIAELFESNGISVARQLLIKKAEDDLETHIRAFCNHIQCQCRFPSEFANNPMHYYAPVKGVGDCNVEIPSWWHSLSGEVWESLLDDSGPVDPKGELEVKCINPVCPPSITSMGVPVVTQAVVELQLRLTKGATGRDVIISRASGRKDFTELDTVSLNGSEILTWVDEDVPEHSSFVRYQFESYLKKPVILKCITLDSYEPGVVFYSLGASKIGLFKWKKGKDPSNKKRDQYECEIKMKGIGSHKFDMFYAEGLKHNKTISGYETNSEHMDDEPCSIVPSSDNHSVCLLDTDEECYYEFSARRPGEEEEKWYRIWLEADDYEPTGVSSEYERLVKEHCNANTSGGLRVEVRSSRLLDFEGWCLSSPNSYLPVILGDGLQDSWTKPNWEKHAVISKFPIVLDPRPLSTEFNPPENILSLRGGLCEILKKLVEKTGGAIEYLRFSELMSDTTFSDTLTSYLKDYAAWLADDYDIAIWMDVISVHTEEHGSDCLQSVPDAILLTPLHPLKLAWQCNAHQILQESLDHHKQCSVAGVLNPSSFPDCMVLSCRNASGHFDKKGYIALPSTSDYWSVLWNIQKIPNANDANERGVFGRDFGLSIEGLTSSFNVQQVKRSLDEIKRVVSAKSTLQISIASDTKGSSTCNDGISEWCSVNMGLDNDEWSAAGPMSLFVYDSRQEDLHPEPAILASLTVRSGENVRWFTENDNNRKENRDLSIIAHLGTMNSEFLCYGIKSQVDPTCINRMSIRKQTSVENKHFLAQSRVGSFVHDESICGIAGLLSNVMKQVEIQCVESQIFDSLTFAPNMVTLKNALENSSYCAVSSSTVDASCFFSGTENSYIWDYELPLYSRGGGGNSSGFYLLAKESENMVIAVKESIQQLGEIVVITDDKAKSLLREISHRGVPTLKKLTSGGAVSFGEIGMLVALRVLQTEFQPEEVCEGILPAIGHGEIINLIVPADIFQPRYDSLRISFGKISGERPDLIAISIRMSDGVPVSIRITSIEVKARATEMPDSQRKEALGQAVSFSVFLAKLKERSTELSLWGVAWRDTLATWIDYGFRVYGQLDRLISNKVWTEAHEAVLGAIMSNSIDIQIDEIGRLICIDGSSKGKVVSVDQDDFRETLILTHEESYQLLDGEQEKVINGIKNVIGDWSIYPKQVSNNDEEQESNHGSGSKDLDENAKGDGSGSSPEEDVLVDVEGEASTGIKFVVGNSLDAFGNTNIEYFPSNTGLNHMNMGIVGDLGTGKTQLLKSLIMQVIQNPASNRGVSPSFLILDYKRDYSDSDFVKKTNARVVSPFNIPLNMFNTADCVFKEKQRQWFDRSRFFNDLLSKIFAGIGAVQKENIKNAIKKSFVEVENGDPTIYDVFDAYKDIKDGAIDSPYGIMSDMIDGGYFEQDKEKIIPFSDFFNGVVVVDLSAIGQDDNTKNMLVAIFLNLYYEYMLKIEKKPFSGNDPQLRFINSFVLVDEADSIMKYEFSVLKKLLLQGREFGVGIILASQYLSHFKTQHEDYMEPLLTWFVHRVPIVTVNQLEKLGLSNVGQDTLNRISRLGLHECLCKTLGVHGEFIRGRPFYELH